MNLQRKLYPFLTTHIQNRGPAPGEVFVASVNVSLASWREKVELSPDATSGETVDDRNAEEPCCPNGVLHFFGRTTSNALGISIAPDSRRQNGSMPLIDRVIAHTLANKMIANGKTLQAEALQEFSF